MSNDPISPESLIQKLEWRYATKKFDPTRKIPAAHWEALEKALVLSASSFGLQPWRFVVVQDPALRAQLLPHSWNQGQVVDASHFVVLAARRGMDSGDIQALIQRTAEVRGVDAEKLEGYRKMIAGFHQMADTQGWLDAWSARQVYIALGNLLTSAALLGIDTCPLEGIDPARYDTLLGLSGYTTLCAVAVGYRAADDAAAGLPKVRFPHDRVVEVR